MFSVVVPVQTIEFSVYAACTLLLMLAALYLGKWSIKNLIIFISTAFVLLVVANTSVKIYNGHFFNQKTREVPVYQVQPSIKL